MRDGCPREDEDSLVDNRYEAQLRTDVRGSQQGGVHPLFPRGNAAAVLCWNPDFIDVPKPDPLNSGRGCDGQAAPEHDVE